MPLLDCFVAYAPRNDGLGRRWARDENGVMTSTPARPRARLAMEALRLNAMTQRISLDVNGRTHTIEADPDMPLLYALRNDLGLNNPQFGCGLAQCGACTVHLDGAPARSCITSVSAAAVMIQPLMQ